ncbi:MAG: PLP-dependent aminotransferase family protein [Gemmatimonadetes bacterium]|nr:PLP-dependent aminotransferase family protein [Gemmatimonadota bacterium]
MKDTVKAPGYPLAAWTESLRRSALEDMLVETARPDVLSLALGLPAPELFPAEGLGQAVRELRADDPRALQYEPPRADLREFVARLVRRRGIDCAPEQVFLTAGAQQGMSFAARLLLNEGATVIVEEACYTGFQQVLAPHRPRVVTVPTKLDDGLDVDALERALRHGASPALLYAMSDGHNPTGVSMSAATRERLVGLAREHRFPILEDDAYASLVYDGEDRPALRALDADWVISVGSFSKTLAPALRVGWMIVPERMLGPLSSLKESSDINTTTLGQRAAARYVASGGFDAHVGRMRTEYARRRDALLEALRATFPAGSRWSTPRSGFFVWVELPDGLDAVRLLEISLREERVAFIPGAAFAAGSATPARSALRLNFSYSSPERLHEAVARIARAIERLREEKDHD